MLKIVVQHNIFVEIGFTDEYKVQKNKKTNLCNIINTFTATVDQFNASLMNKSSNYLKTKHILLYT